MTGFLKKIHFRRLEIGRILQIWLAINKDYLNYMKSKFVNSGKRGKVFGNIEVDKQIIATFMNYKYSEFYFDTKLN